MFWLQIDDPRLFPQRYGEPFPSNFMQIVQTIFKRLFRVYAHIYHSHFRSICALNEEAHLNTCFKHFMHFTQVGCFCGFRIVMFSPQTSSHTAIYFEACSFALD